MLTDKEHELITNIGKVMNGFHEIQDEFLIENPDLKKYDGDWNELCLYIHQLQNWVLSNSAARSHPTMYRPFGLQFDKTKKEGGCKDE